MKRIMEDTMTKLIQLSILLFVVLFSVPSNAIEVNVRTLDGKHHRVQLDDSASIWSLKEQMVAKTGIPIDKQRIIAAGREAKNNEKIASIPEDHRSPFHLVKIAEAPQVSAPQIPQVSDDLREARNSFNAHLRSGDHDMARMTAQSIIDSRRYTTPQKDEARSWLAKIPK